MRKLSIYLVTGLLALSFLADSAIAADLIPLRDFFRNPEKANFQISPDGKNISFLQPYEKRLISTFNRAAQNRRSASPKSRIAILRGTSGKATTI